jgi:hypothetical protein
MLSKDEVFGFRRDPYSEKIRSIRRSILPAKRNKARNAAKDRAALHSNERAKARRNLNSYVISGEDCELELGDSRHYRIKIRQFVSDRRDYDHSSALIRWAQTHKYAFKLPIESRLAFMRGILKGGLAGRHSVQHISGIDGYYWRPRYTSNPQSGFVSSYQEQQAFIKDPDFVSMARFFNMALPLACPDSVYDGRWSTFTVSYYVNKYLQRETDSINKSNSPVRYISKLVEVTDRTTMERVMEHRQVSYTKKIKIAQPLLLEANNNNTVEHIELWLRELWRRYKVEPKTLPSTLFTYEKNRSTNEERKVRRRKLNPLHSKVFLFLVTIMFDFHSLVRKGVSLPSRVKDPIIF